MVLAFVLDLRHPGFHPPMKLLTESRRCLQDTNVLWFNPDCGLNTRKYTEVKPCSQQWLVNCSMVLLEHGANWTAEEAEAEDSVAHLALMTLATISLQKIHTHMCYSNFNDMSCSIKDMDANVIIIEESRSDETAGE